MTTGSNGRDHQGPVGQLITIVSFLRCLEKINWGLNSCILAFLALGRERFKRVLLSKFNSIVFFILKQSKQTKSAFHQATNITTIHHIPPSCCNCPVLSRCSRRCYRREPCLRLQCKLLTLRLCGIFWITNSWVGFSVSVTWLLCRDILQVLCKWEWSLWSETCRHGCKCCLLFCYIVSRFTTDCLL